MIVRRTRAREAGALWLRHPHTSVLPASRILCGWHEADLTHALRGARSKERRFGNGTLEAESMAGEDKTTKRAEMPRIPSEDTRVGMMAHVAIPCYLEWRRKRQEAARGEPVAT